MTESEEDRRARSRIFTRRQLLAMGSSAVATALAGCSEVGLGDDDNGGGSDISNRDLVVDDKEEVMENQVYEIPPVKTLHPYATRAEGVDIAPGIASVIWKETEDFDDLKQFADELTFELFVYGTYPVGDDIELKKLTEKTTHIGMWNDDIWTDDGETKDFSGEPYPKNDPGSNHVYLEYDPEEVPKNQQIRFRLRITNNRTGKQEWAHDESMVYYLQYDDEYEFVYNTIRGRDSEDPYPYNEYTHMDRIMEETSDSYRFVHRVMTEFPSEIHNEIPFSEEAEVVPETEYDEYNFPSDSVHHGDIIDIPKDAVEFTQEWYDSGVMNEYDLDALQLQKTVPSNYDYHGQDIYDVLDNPLLTTLADNINSAVDDYGVDNHYARIQSAVQLIQATDYSDEKGLKYQPPEVYFTGTGEPDCTSHAMNLAWLLYHLDYPVGLAYLQQGEPVHVGPVVGVPEEVIQNEFPEYVTSRFQNDPEYDSPIEDYGLIDEFSEVHPESLGDLQWMYIESTAYYPMRRGHNNPNKTVLGNVPDHSPVFEYSDLSIEVIYEPDNPRFETGIDNTLPQ